MYRVPAAGASYGLRWGILSLAAIVGLLAITTDPSDARGRRKRYHVKRIVPTEMHSPRYAAIVVDAKTGNAIHQANPDSLRHPASLTKIMTLYLLFERLEAGKIKLGTPMEVSDEAASQAPTKLGLRPGQTLSVEDAIKALVTKSANDAAVVVAEAIAGNEDEFARLMTRKARTLGMNRTVYRNASGLPNEEQVTTAREQAILGMAIQERFPRYYRYFAMSSFVYRGHAMRNHNRLLGRVDGVDGIKTGYTRASGFNLVSSVRRGERHIVAVVLGGPSAGARDARMRTLIESHIAEASIKPAVTKIATVPPPAPSAEPATKPALASTVSKPVTLKAPRTVPVPAPAPTPAPTAAPEPKPASVEATAAIPAPPAGSTEPIKPIAVRTIVVRLAPPKAAPAAELPVKTVADAPSVVAAPSVTVTPPAAPEPKPTPDVEAPAPAAPVAAPPAPRPSVLAKIPAAVGNAIIPSTKASEAPRADAPRKIVRHGWIIQVGAYEAESEAKQKLNAAQAKALRLLDKADPYVERTTKGDKTYYRARFAGIDRDQAEAACRALKRSDMACMALKI